MKLNIEQRRIIELEPNGHVLIKGVAGSGKTTVSIHRISFLQKHYCPEKEDKVLLVTFNKTLLNFIKYQYEDVKEEVKSEVHNLFSANNEVAIQNIDKLMYPFFQGYQKRHQVSYKIAHPATVRRLLDKAIFIVSDRYPDIKLLSSKYNNFLLDEIEWILACDLYDKKTYQEIDRIGRAGGGQNTPQKLNKNSQTRAAIFELMELYTQLLKKENIVSFKMMNKMALEEAAHLEHTLYTHIIIDESQDLSKVQLQFLKHLHAKKSYASIMFVADNTQSIYSQSWLGKGRPYSSLGYDMSGKSRTLSKNYRTTTEISKAAYSLIENDEQISSNADFVKPSLIDRHGHAPIYKHFSTAEQQIEYIINEIRLLKNDYNLWDICIVTKEKRFLENAKTVLDKNGIPSHSLNINNPNFKQNSVKLTTMHSIKGLEFKVIFLIDLNEDVIPNNRQSIDDNENFDSEERKLLYVGMTRASELLYMTSVNAPSIFIQDIDNEALRLMKDCSIHPFQSIPIQDYQLADSIVDKGSKEEVVRQWMVNELQKTYGYPLELLTLEYPVQQFSKTGYVDIAITIEAHGQRIPYVFVETKADDTPLESAREQLLSYIRTTPSVEFGIVCNKYHVQIFNRNGVDIIDIPPCLPQFIPNDKNEMMYKDLRHHVDYLYVQDKKDSKHIEFIEKNSQVTLYEPTTIAVPIVGNVAAGIPIEAVESYEDTILLNEDWIMNQENTFALKVTGDSMVDAGIDIGDLVIVHKQNTANNRDIVIALIDQEVTVKTFMLMGSTVLLISENDNYEPIQMSPEDVSINGKVIGVLKK